MHGKKAQTWAVVVIALFVGGLVLACSGPAATNAVKPAAEEAGLSEGSDGEAFVAERCTGCHDLARIERASYSREEWEQNVSRMVAKGANLTPEEQAAVVDYLAETYGP